MRPSKRKHRGSRLKLTFGAISVAIVLCLGLSFWMVAKLPTTYVPTTPTQPSLRSDVACPAKSPFTSKSGAFVHIGKTAGSTISLLLADGCHSFMTHPCRSVPHETAASRLIGAYYHVPDFGKLKESQHDFYVVSTRDPFDRTVSAFLYDHLSNRLARNDTVDPFKLSQYQDAYSCFDSLEAFVQLLTPGDSTTFDYPYRFNEIHTDSCRDFARAALHGRVRLFHHFYFQYQRIRDSLPDQAVVYVVRQEHLWDDWKKLNCLLGGENVVLPADEFAGRKNSSTWEADHQMPVGRELSAEGTKILCKALEHEYAAYVWFLRQARNLEAKDILAWVKSARQRCPDIYIDLSV